MEIPRHWRLKGQRYRLEGVVCEEGDPVFPPKPFCKDGHKTPIHPQYVQKEKIEFLNDILITVQPTSDVDKV